MYQRRTVDRRHVEKEEIARADVAISAGFLLARMRGVVSGLTTAR